MHIHHLNCGTDCPIGGALFDGRTASLTGRLVLIETGYGLKDVHHPTASRTSVSPRRCERG